jgi:hypothetical protein
MMRNVVTVLNVLSSLASLWMLWLGSRVVSDALLYIKFNDAFVTVGRVLVTAFLIVPPVCVVESTKLARQNSGWSIVVSLVPVALAIIAGPVALPIRFVILY